MKYLDLGASAILCLVICTPAMADDYQLSCVMNDYSFGARTAGIENVVPAQSTHVVRSSLAKTAEISMVGSAVDAGSRLKLHYIGYLEPVGDIEVNYTYIKASGVTVATTKALRNPPFDGMVAPEKRGEFVIHGHCALK